MSTNDRAEFENQLAAGLAKALPGLKVMKAASRPHEVREINAEHYLAQQRAKEAIKHAVRCGELLLEQKRKLAHGQFMMWVEENCEFKYPTAARYMKAAEQSSTGVEISTLSALFDSGRPKPKIPAPAEKNDAIGSPQSRQPDPPLTSASPQNTPPPVVFADGQRMPRAWRGRRRLAVQDCLRWEEASKEMKALAWKFAGASRHEQIFQVVLLMDLFDLYDEVIEIRHALRQIETSITGADEGST